MSLFSHDYLFAKIQIAIITVAIPMQAPIGPAMTVKIPTITNDIATPVNVIKNQIARARTARVAATNPITNHPSLKLDINEDILIAIAKIIMTPTVFFIISNIDASAKASSAVN
jgi:hypothetical protein